MAGAEGTWRLVVRIGATHPELRAELAPLPSRARAERLRQLALVGWHCLRAGAPPTVPGDAGTTPALGARRERLLHALGAEADECNRL
jgi:hypothetical protein